MPLPRNRRPAPLARRVIAYTIDITIVGFVLTVLSGVFGVVAGILFSINGAPALVPDPNSPLQVRLADGVPLSSLGILLGFVVLFAFAVVVIYHGYFIWYETRTGQTPGKRWLGIRVVSEDGPFITRRQATWRDFMRYIDIGLLLPGLIAILLDPKEARRLGDRVAKTRVVLEEGISP